MRESWVYWVTTERVSGPLGLVGRKDQCGLVSQSLLISYSVLACMVVRRCGFSTCNWVHLASRFPSGVVGALQPSAQAGQACLESWVFPRHLELVLQRFATYASSRSQRGYIFTYGYGLSGGRIDIAWVCPTPYPWQGPSWCPPGESC